MPVRLPYEPDGLQLAASLGDEAARKAMSPEERRDLDDAFAVLMSCCEVVQDLPGVEFGPARLWTYTLQAAMRMAVAVYREYLPDWRSCFKGGRQAIPGHIPSNFAPRMVATVSRWILEPSSFSWDEHKALYEYIKDDICLDGYLENRFPETPAVVRSYCYGSIFLIDIENCQPAAAPVLREYDPQGRYAAWMSDAIGWFLREGMDENRIRRAIRREVVPWCLGRRDPLVSRTRGPKKEEKQEAEG